MPTDELERRVAALEALIAAAVLVQPAYTPLDGLKVGADGSVSYDFDGHLHAQGLDLDTRTNPGFYGPGSTSSVQWGLQNGPGVAGAALEGAASAGGLGSLWVTAKAAAGTFRQRQLLDSDGSSDYLLWSGGSPQLRGVALYAAAQRVAGPVSSGATVTFANVPAGLAIAVYAASAYQNFAGATAYVDCAFDGAGVGASAVYCNELGSHRATVPLITVPGQIGAGTHTMSFQTNGANGTGSDANDIYQALLIVL